MAAVKGSKQYQMVVVPHRPLYKSGVFCLFLLAMLALGGLTYEYGMKQGLALKKEVVKEKQSIAIKLDEAQREVGRIRQEIADLKLGGQIDSQANEEIRTTVEALQQEIAELSEEIRFYKGVMLPNVEDKGLRIERLDMVNTPNPNTYKYSLLLTQVVDKHDYVQGGVRIAVRGKDGEYDKELTLSELDASKQDAIRFRFRYFQNIDGELLVPDGFEPTEVSVVAQSSGRNGQRLERKFGWQLNGG